MRIGIMQPYIFPYIGYFQLIRDADLFIVYDDVNFRKRSWISRNRILLNHDEYRFSLHLSRVSSAKKINEIEVGSNREKLVKTIRQAYIRAPYFCKTMPFIEELFLFDEKNLVLYLMHQLESLSRYFGMDTSFMLSSSIIKDDCLSGQAKILAICNQLGATAYSNPIGGQYLYSRQDFANYGIDLKFIRPDYIEYRQFGNEFIPWLSIIDVMMFNSNSQIRKWLVAYQRISGGICP